MTLMMAQGDLSWTQAFIGLPYADKGRDWTGCDCWGFLCIVHAERAGTELPSYEGISSAERQEIAAIVAQEASSPVWRVIGHRDGSAFRFLEEPREMDIAWFRRGRHDAHAGLYLRRGLMMHMVEEDCSKIERFDCAPWQSRLTGIYRWRGA